MHSVEMIRRRRIHRFGLGLCLWAFGVLGGTIARADDADRAEEAARLLANPLEKQGYYFRAEAWVNDLAPAIGKAVRVQLFKGNDYRFCVAVPPKSGVQTRRRSPRAGGRLGAGGGLQAGQDRCLRHRGAPA